MNEQAQAGKEKTEKQKISEAHRPLLLLPILSPISIQLRVYCCEIDVARHYCPTYSCAESRQKNKQIIVWMNEPQTVADFFSRIFSASPSRLFTWRCVELSLRRGTISEQHEAEPTRKRTEKGKENRNKPAPWSSSSHHHIILILIILSTLSPVNVCEPVPVRDCLSSILFFFLSAAASTTWLIPFSWSSLS